MKTVNVAELKNKLSLYLDQVEQGEEIVVKNRKKAVAKLVPIRTSNIKNEEWELVSEGKLRLPEKMMSKKFLKDFLGQKMPVVSRGTSVDAVLRDRDER